MSDNPLYAELDRLRTELAANKRVAAQLEEQRAKAEKRVRELEGQLTDASRVCDTPGCLAAVVRRDDGSRICAAGHNSRWVDSVELIRARGVNEELERQLVASWNVRDAQRKEIAEAQASCAGMKEALEAWQKAEGLEIELGQCGRTDRAYHEAQQQRDMALTIDAGKAMLERMAKMEVAVAEMRTVLEQCFDYLTMLSFVAFWEKWGTGVKATTWGTADKFVATNITKALAIKEAPDV